MILLTGRLIREAVLQQSALSPNDGYAARPKQAAIADSVLIVHDRCLELISKGVPASLLEEVDFSPLIRARDVAGPADVDTVTKRRDEVLALLPDAMSNRAPIEYTDIRRVEGPLLVAAGIDGVGWDEDAEIVLEGDGGASRRRPRT